MPWVLSNQKSDEQFNEKEAKARFEAGLFK
jgi:hypothetical protein